MLGQQADDRLQIALHAGRHVRPGLAEILEVGGGIDQHLARAIVAIAVIALARRHLLHPTGEIGQFFLGLLGEEIIADADGQLIVLMQLLDDLIIVGIILEAAARVDHAGDAQRIDVAHEVAGRIELIVLRQLWPLGQGRIEDGRIGLGQQQAGRVAGRVADDLAARRIGRVLGIAHDAQRGGVEQRAIIEVQDEDRRVGRDGIQFGDGRQALFRELMFGEAAYHAHPLRSRGTGDLAFKHIHRLGQRRHAIPAQFHVEIQAAANDVHMAIDQAGDQAMAPGIDHRCVRRGGAHLRLAANGQELAVADRDRLRHWIFAVQRRHLGIDDDRVGHGAVLGLSRKGSEKGGGGHPGHGVAAGNHASPF